MLDLPAYQTVAWLGFAAGLAFGAIAQRTNFCTMGALSDVLYMGSFVRLRMWLLAMAVAIAGSQALAATDLVDLGGSIYLAPSLGWLGAILGGLLFGFGMTIAGGCGNRNLVRLGAGNLKSLVVLLVLGFFAYMTLRGLTGALRVAVIEPAAIDLRRFGFETQGLPAFLSAAGIGPATARAVVAFAAVATLLAYCLSDPEFRARPAAIGGGVGIGALIVAGWAITGIAGADDFEPTPIASFTFIAPTGDALVYAMTWTGARMNFGIATVLGVIVGAFLAAKASGEFRIEAFSDVADMKRHLGGAALMGIGGVTALGCTIGQGLTGISTLAAGSVIAVLAICVGGYAGFKYLEEGTLVGALRAIAERT
ncbi:MAG: YeeE/YedE family protein [Alphaproteobacteria bacterium]|nr:YeeE/YedE family protein [Alphaproteobacteria bacterium]